MTTPPLGETSFSQSDTPLGLRLRLWIGCLGGALVSAAGMWVILGLQSQPDAGVAAPAMMAWLAGAALLGIVVGGALALWLNARIVIHVRGLVRGVATGQVSELRGLPAGAGWGELSELTQQIQLLIMQHRQAVRATEELGVVRQRLALLRESLERWVETERWNPVRGESGLLAPPVELLNRGLGRLEDVREQNQEAVRKVSSELGRALNDARESAEQAESGFVGATALLTTVRELQRLSSELENAATSRAPEPDRDDTTSYRQAARAAIEELVTTSADCVEHLASGLLRVQEVVDHVQILGNRATLIALDAALGSSNATHVPGASGQAEELRRLAQEVRRATDAVTRLSGDVEMRVAVAVERMRAVRDRVGLKLDLLPQPPDEAAGSSRDLDRLLARVHEMIQDAAQKGERLSTSAERVSRAAERLVRGLEEETAEVSGLLVRLSPPEPSAVETPEPERPSTLRLIGGDELLGETPRARREERP
ncbi:MAG TPA: methyl-accepting chemotaxis protein [Candidatus Limnocylindria bacterium]|nr:methyl-accepting chemotaxis protein [Candidatus Limnocylindria bacterium]